MSTQTTQTTTSVHRPRCTRPGWDVQHSHAVHGIAIATCRGCGAVELRKEVQ